MPSDTVDLSTYVKACGLQIIVSLIPFVRILKTRRASGFSVDSQLFYIMGFAFKYLHYPLTNMETPDDSMRMQIIHYWIRIVLTIILAITFFVSANVPEYFHEKIDIYWLFGGIIASFVLATDFVNYDRSHFTTIVCTFGSYLDVISWIPQFKLNLKKMRIDKWLAIYIVGLYSYDSLSMSHQNRDYYQIFVNRNIRLKHTLLKLFLLYGFIIKYYCRRSTSRIESMHEINCESSIVNEVVVVSSAEEYSNKMLFQTLGLEDVLVQGTLMLPY